MSITWKCWSFNAYEASISVVRSVPILSTERDVCVEGCVFYISSDVRPPLSHSCHWRVAGREITGHERVAAADAAASVEEQHEVLQQRGPQNNVCRSPDV